MNTIGLKGLSLIKKFEGCELKAYKCPSNVWTIGFGSTFYEDGTKVRYGDGISQERANELFLQIVKKFVDGVDRMVTSKVTQNQFDAMVSLAYNIGLGGFKRSSVLRKVNLDPTIKSIGDSFRLWNKGNGVVLTGLVRRREAEVILFETP
jgi:lysozyme